MNNVVDSSAWLEYFAEPQCRAVRRCDRRHRPPHRSIHHTSLPLADSIILAAARAFNAILWTQDADFNGIEGVRYFPSAEA
jgi:predicted nucleic acid-binding protein